MTATQMTPEERRAEAERIGRPLPEDQPRKRPPATSSNETPPDDLRPIGEELDGVIERIKKRIAGTPKPDPAAEERAREQMERRRAELALERLRRIVPPKFMGANIDQVDPRVRAWIERDDHARGLVLTGGTGTGKTHAMWAIFDHLTRSDPVWWATRRIAVWKVVSLLQRLRPAGEGESIEVSWLTGAALLMLDDLGVQKQSDWVDERLYEIIDTRYEHMMPTVFTTNVPPPKFSDALGDRLASRLAESCDIIALTGKDRRRG